VELHADYYKYFGFAYQDEQGVDKYYVYTRLPFGLNSSVNVVDRLLRPHKVFCHKFSVDLSIFIDDGISIGSSALMCLVYFKFVIFLLAYSGWKLQKRKCSLSPQTKITYLGYVLDSIQMSISVPLTKIKRLNFLIDNMLHKAGNNIKITCKSLSSLCGLMAHMIVSHGGFIKIVSRHCQQLLGQSVIDKGWQSTFILNSDCIHELKLCIKYASKFNGQKLRPDLLEVEVFSPHNVKYLVESVSAKTNDADLDIFFSGKSI
jgi:hypothetical protein